MWICKTSFKNLSIKTCVIFLIFLSVTNQLLGSPYAIFNHVREVLVLVCNKKDTLPAVLLQWCIWGTTKEEKRKESQEKENECLGTHPPPLGETNEWTNKTTHTPKGSCVGNMSCPGQNVPATFRNTSVDFSPIVVCWSILCEERSLI